MYLDRPCPPPARRGGVRETAFAHLCVKVLTGGAFDFNWTKLMWQNKDRFRLGVIGSTGVFGALSLGSSPRGGAGETGGEYCPTLQRQDRLQCRRQRR